MMKYLLNALICAILAILTIAATIAISISNPNGLGMIVALVTGFSSIWLIEKGNEYMFKFGDEENRRYRERRMREAE